MLKKIDELRSIPWLTSDAIAFLENFLHEIKDPKILEFGCGASTIWFAKRTKNLVSIEHNKQWYEKVKEHLENSNLTNNVDLRLIEEDYYKVVENFLDDFFDLILIDGIQRIKCAKNSIRILKKGGVLMLDNAERQSYKQIYEILKNWEFHKTIQTKPDIYGSYYKNWQTNWWIKE